MSDTIDLLEAIGRDASLRHAAPEELMPMLEKEQASDALKAAVAAGDSSLLGNELGYRKMHVGQVTQGPGHEDGDGDDHHDHHDHDHDHDHDHHDHGHGEPDKPGHDKPSKVH